MTAGRGGPICGDTALARAEDRYRLGVDSYLNVITAQSTLFSTRRTGVNIRLQQMTATVQLVKALGGGWDASRLPSQDAVAGSSLIFEREPVTSRVPPTQEDRSIFEPVRADEQSGELALPRSRRGRGRWPGAR